MSDSQAPDCPGPKILASKYEIRPGERDLGGDNFQSPWPPGEKMKNPSTLAPKFPCIPEYFRLNLAGPIGHEHSAGKQQLSGSPAAKGLPGRRAIAKVPMLGRPDSKFELVVSPKKL